jgi:hypothetical protein
LQVSSNLRVGVVSCSISQSADSKWYLSSREEVVANDDGPFESFDEAKLHWKSKGCLGKI